MALAISPLSKPAVGREHPRLAPPRPLKTHVELLTDEAECMGIVLMPSQLVVGRYLYAVGPDDNWLYQEIADIVARQNGKTEILKPHICARLRKGRRVMHSAQNRELPREVFGHIAEHMETKHAGELAKPPRFANGQEEILLRNGGRYRIVAPTRGGARGPSNDDLILDEVRELVTHDFPAAATPTLSASQNPQTLYLSNMGDETSVVLNTLKLRSTEDRALAYLEWSAAPERRPDDRTGWLEANPSVGHLPGKMRNLEREYESNRLGGTMTVWETEYLCRPVITMRERLVDDHDWQDGHVEDAGTPQRPAMAVSMDPSGERAAAAIAWQLPNDEIGVRVLFEWAGDPIDTATIGREAKQAGLKVGVRATGFDPLTDKELAKFLPSSKPVTGAEYANASALFATKVKAGKVKWDAADAVTEDLIWTAKKPHDQSGSYQAVRARDDRPIPAALAVIRAVWLASGPAAGLARIY